MWKVNSFFKFIDGDCMNKTCYICSNFRLSIFIVTKKCSHARQKYFFCLIRFVFIATSVVGVQYCMCRQIDLLFNLSFGVSEKNEIIRPNSFHPKSGEYWHKNIITNKYVIPNWDIKECHNLIIVFKSKVSDKLSSITK